MTVEPLHAASRRVLLDALEDLAEHRNAVIVVGAQAVYLRTRLELPGVAEFTTDGDLALATDHLSDSPLLGDAMRARFRPAGPAGAEEPGASQARRGEGSRCSESSSEPDSPLE